jgi:hypothetical protein
MSLEYIALTPSVLKEALQFLATELLAAALQSFADLLGSLLAGFSAATELLEGNPECQ